VASLQEAVSGAIKRHPQAAAAAAGVAAVAAAGLAAYVVWRTVAPAREGRHTEARLRMAGGGSGTRELTEQEKALEKDFVAKGAIGVDFDDVGGLEEQIREIEDLVLLPLSHAHLYRHSRIASQPTGILLYGPPGTGKTLLAKAIAMSAKASFLSVNIASLESKWFGETPKLVEAMFSLARKRAPCVMFIDEVDGKLTGELTVA